MNPELFHLVPEILEWLYHNHPSYFQALVTVPIGFLVVIIPVALIAEIRKERQRERRAREVLTLAIGSPARPLRRRNRLIDWAALIIFILSYAAAVAYLLWAVGVLKL